MQKNPLVIALDEKHNIRIHLADTTTLVEQARKMHHLQPTSLAALGRVLSITAVMGSMLKGERESVNVTINGGGVMGTVMATAKNNGEVKGFVANPDCHEVYPGTKKLAVGVCVGREGMLSVTKNLEMKQRYTTQVALQTGEIGDDFAFYFAKSEQRPSVVSLGVLVDTDYSTKAAGVFFMELLPGHREEDIVYLEEVCQHLSPISSLISSGKTLYEIMKEYFPDAEILEIRELTYRCDCSKERFRDGLMTLPNADLEELATEGGSEIRCDFCQKNYFFSQEELSELLHDRH